ncbi:hypothetical protein [Lacrimispora indolis]|uniref:hypothetical protein n=1 Tax=Lacrimispora indolis TaxID=69825 RepID=UPI00045EA3BF|nr:hypothetical protein [Lacrimispora indolis]MBE7721306.1 hypothetical protein [Lacrimispora celerecrescens]
MNQRIVWIINYLVSDSKVSPDLLFQHYHVSKRTLHDGINAINSLMEKESAQQTSFLHPYPETNGWD